MDTVVFKRHSNVYVRVLKGWLGHFLIGFAVVVLVPGLLLWGVDGYVKSDLPKINSLFGVAISYVGVIFTFRRMLSYPGCQSAGYILPTILVWYGFLVSFFFVFRLDYSVYYIFYTAILNTVFCFVSYFYIAPYLIKRIALLPIGKAESLSTLTGVEWCKLSSATLNGEPVDAIAADLHADIPEQWQRFLAHSTLAGVPVYHYKQLQESLTGRVRINHLSENELGSLQPPALYSFIKRLLDISAVLLTAPVTVPVMLLTAMAVKLDSPGPALFVQNRVGQGNRDFKIYKFRSMCRDSEANGAQLAQSNDMRVTRVGKFIRKTRLDEFPQFYNVLKGDMSLIGPRPEQRAFVEQFDQEIPFYIYRHVVKPGITGWAQVVHGYAGDADDTRVKIQHDFYYIKHFSMWLDLLIAFKTIKTVFTGFGAR